MTTSPQNAENSPPAAGSADNSPPASVPTPAPGELKAKVIDAIRMVYDPEIPINIYDLGLIYDVDVAPGGDVHVKMTLTAPGCPVAGSLPPEVERRIESLPEVHSARVELVWEPPWSKDMMSEAALLELGLL